VVHAVAHANVREHRRVDSLLRQGPVYANMVRRCIRAGRRRGIGKLRTKPQLLPNVSRAALQTL
jgi:hypothetical protein